MRKKDLNISKEQIEYVIKTYPLKQDAADYLGIRVDQIRDLVNKYGLVYPITSWKKGTDQIKNYTFIDKQWLIDNWVNTTKSMAMLSEEFNVPESIIDARRAKYKVVKSYKYPINVTKFTDTTDAHIWYLAGLIATDGYVPSDHDAVEIDLTGQSELQLLNDIIQYYELKMTAAKYGNSYRVRIAFDGLQKFLLNNFNICNGAKTFTVDIPTDFPNETCAKAYILGCMDGDGSISKDGDSFSLLTASQNLVYGIRDIYKHYTNIELPCQTILGNTGNYYPQISSTNKKARDFLTWLYSEKEKYFYLQRKYERFKNNRYNKGGDINE